MRTENCFIAAKNIGSVGVFICGCVRLPGDIWDALDTQLRAAGITWIRVNSVENPADGTFEVWFDLDENKDNMSRSIHMGYSYSAYFIITQLKQDQEHFEGLYADLPANRKFEVLPGEEISIQLHGLSAGNVIRRIPILFRERYRHIRYVLQQHGRRLSLHVSISGG